MIDDDDGGSFREYRQLILAHMESSDRRQSAMEKIVTDLKVQMGVLVVKVSLVVGIIILISGAIATAIVRNAVESYAPPPTAIRGE